MTQHPIQLHKEQWKEQNRENMSEYVMKVRFKLTLSTVLQDAHPLANISQVESCLVVTTHVLPDLSCNQGVHNY